MHKIIIFALLITITFLISSCSENNDENSQVTENMKTVNITALIKKTMQIQSYNEEGNEVFDISIKNDGYYQKGLEPTYTRTSEIVKDELTSLMWQDNKEVTTIVKSYLNDDNFALCNANKSSPYCSNTSGDTATTYCSELGLGGYSDWRVPSVYELANKVDIIKKPSISENFINSITDQYISSTPYISDFHHNLVWGVHFSYGSTSSYPNNHKVRVRCVIDDNAQTLNTNKMEWQDNERSSSLKWEEAINYCEELNLNGMGWRLPNINELKSIVDYSKNNPAIKSSFSEITPLQYWSSSTNHTSKNFAWSISFRNGDVWSSVSKKQKHQVRCVR